MNKRSHDPLAQLRKNVRRELRKNDGPIRRMVSRIGRVIARPSSGKGDVRRYRHGVGMLMLAVFVLLLTALFLPRDNGRWMFGIFGFLMALVGCWQIDKARR
jgi:hypothetical protein